MKLRLLIISFLSIVSISYAQIQNPVSWSVKASGNKVVMTATIDAPWHMYDQGPYSGGPNATAFTFTLPEGVKLIGKVKQITQPTKVDDPVFNMKIGYFAGKAVFEQTFENTTGKVAVISGSVEWQVCDDDSCLPPTDYDFKFNIEPTKSADKEPAKAEDLVSGKDTAKGDASGKDAVKNDIGSDPSNSNSADVDGAIKAEGKDAADSIGQTIQESDSVKIATTPLRTDRLDNIPSKEKRSIWEIIFAAMAWGLLAIVTPCVFPMLPMTVSFFLKSSGSKKHGRFLASVYGLSIVALYTLPIAALILITYFIGGDSITIGIFNWMATHWLPNTIFFLVFMIFAISFFGAFEITMPSKLVNKTDAKSDRGGLLGTFFMALTLVLVSFSCTGPIVSTALFQSTQGDIWEPIITMIAFSVVFALPFTLFAFFPSLLKNLPKSGGWLNAVKVVLGFIELALGLKFLSVADQTYHWGILDREVYLALWIVIFTLMGFYLLGKLKFKHDSDLKYISVKRLFMAIATLSFVAYLIPGMWGAPLKMLSGYLPPQHTLDFDLTRIQNTGGGSTIQTSYLDYSKIEGGKPKFADFLHFEHGIEGFFDYEQGLDYARKVGKPVMIDFTGHGCVNCREMEKRVWIDPEVLKLIKEQYVMIALYVDDKKELPEQYWITDKNGKVRKTIGKINAEFQIERYGINAQPYYILMDPQDESLLVNPRAYDLSIPGFIDFLKSGVEEYKKR